MTGEGSVTDYSEVGKQLTKKRVRAIRASHHRPYFPATPELFHQGRLVPEALDTSMHL